jgi:hypothetical protein
MKRPAGCDGRALQGNSEVSTASSTAARPKSQSTAHNTRNRRIFTLNVICGGRTVARYLCRARKQREAPSPEAEAAEKAGPV